MTEDYFDVPAHNLICSSIVDFIKPSEKKLFSMQDGEGNFLSITGNSLAEKAKLLGSRLQQNSSPQEKVVLLFPQGIEYIYGLLACWYANLVAVPIPITELSQIDKIVEKVSLIIKNSKATCILINSENDRNIKAVESLHATTVIDVDDISYDDIVVLEERSKHEEELALLLYTSGSTSQPKGVMLSYGNIMSQAYTGAGQWEIDSESCIVSWMPQFHNFGLHFNILVPILKGAYSIILSPDSFVKNAAAWFEYIALHKATHIAAPNFAFDYCSSSIKMSSRERLEKLSLRSLKAIICGGEPVSIQSYKNFEDKFDQLGLAKKILCPHYGLSEAGSVTTNKPGQTDRFITLEIDSLEKNKVKHSKYGEKSKAVVSCGKIEKGITVVIVDKDTCKPCLDDVIGEIWIRSPSVALGYLNAEEETGSVFSATLKEGEKEKKFMRTGDLGFIDEGYLYVIGREKDLIIINGKNYHPVDIEWTIENKLPYFNLATVVFSREVENQEKVVVVQEVEAGLKESDYKAIARDLLNSVLEHHGLKIYEIDLVEGRSIPRTGSGKIQKKACKTQHKEEKLSILYKYIESASSLSSDTDKNLFNVSDEVSIIIEILKISIFFEELSVDKKTLERTSEFSELPMDSLKYVKIAKRIEECFDVNFSPVMLFKYNNFFDLSSYIYEKTESYDLSAKNNKNSQSRYNNQYLKDKSIHTSLSKSGKEQAAIIGMNCHFPGGATDLDTFWNNLLSRKNGVTSIPTDRMHITNSPNRGSERYSVHFPQWGGFIEDVDTFDANFFDISPLEAESMDPQQRKVMELTWSVIESAGYNPKQLGGKNVGLFMGAHSNDYLELMLLQQPSAIETYGAYVDSGLHMSMIANRASRWFNFKGPSEVINTACSSSLVALCHAVESISKGSCDLAIAGGINLILSSRIYGATYMAGMLSEDGACKTFDQQANGFARAEGYGAVLLKSYQQAKIDNDSIYGVIKGVAINHDGRSNSLRAPNVESQKQLIQKAYQTAGISPETVNYIEVHGTGTPLGDPIETEALKEAFEEMSVAMPHKFCGLGTVKTNIGHCESAAGIAGLIKVLLAMKHKALPGILHFNKLNNSISLEKTPFYIVERNQPWPRLKNAKGVEMCRRAGVSSFGFGGVNAHVLIEEIGIEKYGEKEINSSSNGEDSDLELIVLSARSNEQLYKLVSNLHQYLIHQESPQRKEGTGSSLQNIAYTLQVGRDAMKERLAIVVTSCLDLRHKLKEFLESKNKKYDWYTGHVNNESNINQLFTSNEELAAVVDRSLREREIGKLGSLWVKGVEPNWKILHELRSPPPARISLPTYPFAKTRYWLPEVNQFQKQETTSKETNKPACTSTNELTDLQVQETTLNANIIGAEGSGIKDNDLVFFVKDIIARKTGHTIESVDLSANDGEIGIDSIVKLQLVNEIIEKFPQIDIDHHELLVLPRVIDIVTLLQRSLKNGQQAGYIKLSKFEKKINEHDEHRESDKISGENINYILQKIKRKIGNIIIDDIYAKSDRLEGKLIVTKRHDFFNDHPLDHITGVQLIEAMSQLAEVFQAYRKNFGLFYTASVNVVFSKFCEREYANVYCSKIESESIGKSLHAYIQQNQKRICKANLILKEIDLQYNETIETRSKVNPYQIQVCDKKIVNKQNSDNVFISIACTYEENLGCWFLPKRSNTIFNDSTKKIVDTTQLIEACRQYEHVLINENIFRTSLEVDDFSIEHTKGEKIPEKSKALGVLRSLSIDLSRPLHIDEEIFITKGDFKVMTVGNNRFINWKTNLLVNNVNVGSFKLEALLLDRGLYNSWRGGEK